MNSAENAWLQNGYKNFKDAIKSSEYVDFVDELRIISAVFHQKSRPSSRVGIRISCRVTSPLVLKVTTTLSL